MAKIHGLPTMQWATETKQPMDSSNQARSTPHGRYCLTNASPATGAAPETGTQRQETPKQDLRACFGPLVAPRNPGNAPTYNEMAEGHFKKPCTTDMPTQSLDCSPRKAQKICQQPAWDVLSPLMHVLAGGLLLGLRLMRRQH